MPKYKNDCATAPAAEMHPVAFRIACKRDLESDSYQGFAGELLSIASEEIRELSETIFRDYAVTLGAIERIKEVATMLNDSLYMAALGPTNASSSTLIQRKKGPYRLVEIDKDN